jgi:tRNA (pseudouridine54-N1)-methyltransferase
MRTFIIKARKASTNLEKLKNQLGSKDHFEVVLHSIMNAFFIASDFRQNVEVYIIFDGAHDFPITLKLSSEQGLSFSGFHEQAIYKVLAEALLQATGLKKNQVMKVSCGIEALGFGLETLIKNLLEQQRSIFILDKKGEPIRELDFPSCPVFLLSDHLMMPKKTLIGLKRRGLRSLSLGKKMLFASQCVVLIQHELDIQGFD